MSAITIEGVSKSYGTTPVLHALDLEIPGRRLRVVPRPLGLRQEHPSVLHRGPRGDHRRPHPVRRPRHDASSRRATATSRSCSRTTRSIRTCRCAKIWPFRCASRRPSEQAITTQVAWAADLLGLEPVARPLARRIVRRPATARRGGARHRAQSGGAADGRAALQPRCEPAGEDAHRDQAAAARAQDHRRLRHARPGGGDGAVRPHRGHERRRAAAVRRADDDLPRARRICSSPASSARRR